MAAYIRHGVPQSHAPSPHPVAMSNVGQQTIFLPSKPVGWCYRFLEEIGLSIVLLRHLPKSFSIRPITDHLS